jgi:hypothetical protein
MADVPGKFIAAALLPALIISILFYFDHSVSAQLAQVSDFNLTKPSAYHYDLLLLAGVTALLGLMGLPPINGVIPQAPMHSRALARVSVVVRTEEADSVEKKENGIQGEMETAAKRDEVQLPSEPVKPDHHVHLSVTETRLANFLQSAFCFVTLAAMPGVRLIPTAVIWGYFFFLALESLPSSQLFERFMFLLTDPRRRHLVFERPHAACLQTVPFKTIAGFTAIQITLVMGIWALVTFGGLAGIAFPIPIMLLVPVRQYLLPRIFNPRDLAEMDKAEYEEAPGLDRDEALRTAAEVSGLGPGHEDEVIEMEREREEEAIEGEFRGYEVVHHAEPQALRERTHHLDI